MSKKVAVVLSGCGVYDGAEIYEATLVQLRLDEAGIEFQCMAPNVDQMHVINLAKANPADYAAVIFPGGFGAAKNLCNFAVKGPDMQVNPDVVKFVQGMHAQKKPIGLICIAPAMAPKLFGRGVKCTVGDNADPAADAVRAMGGDHRGCPVDQFTIDEDHNAVIQRM
jgi:enhancing lycopene biosynthesis protein 2